MKSTEVLNPRFHYARAKIDTRVYARVCVYILHVDYTHAYTLYTHILSRYVRVMERYMENFTCDKMADLTAVSK